MKVATYRVLQLTRADGSKVRAKGPDGVERDVPDVVTKTLEHDWEPELGHRLGEEFIMKSLDVVPFGDGHARYVFKDVGAADAGGEGTSTGGGEQGAPEDELKAPILSCYDAWKAWKKGGKPEVDAPAWCKPLSPQETPVAFARRAAGEFAKLPMAKAAIESVGAGYDWEDWVTAVMRYEHHEAVQGGGEPEPVEKSLDGALGALGAMDDVVVKGLEVDHAEAFAELEALAKGGPVQVGPRGGHFVQEPGGEKRYVDLVAQTAEHSGNASWKSHAPVAKSLDDYQQAVDDYALTGPWDHVEKGQGQASREHFSRADADPVELAKGIAHEMKEHGMSEGVAQRTALDHLSENPRYYTWLAHEEEELAAYEARASEFCPVCALTQAKCTCTDDTLSAEAERRGTQEVAGDPQGQGVAEAENLGGLVPHA